MGYVVRGARDLNPKGLTLGKDVNKLILCVYESYMSLCIGARGLNRIIESCMSLCMEYDNIHS